MTSNYILSAKSIFLSIIIILVSSSLIFGQSPPNNLTLDEEKHLMTLEGLNTSDFYDEEKLESVYLEFEQSDFWQLLHDSYDTEIYVLGKMTYKGEVIDSIGAQFKGNTSYTKVEGDEKFSLGISLDEYVDGQDIEGYNTLNLNNAFGDPSFMREVLYSHLNRLNIPSAKANFVKLYINDEYWGIYANIQQLNKDFTKEWFMTNNGSLWRANAPSSTETKSTMEGRPPGGKPKWGDGTSALNYLGADTTLYQKYYTLKHSSQENPWDLLVKLTDVLKNTADDNLLAEISKYLDVDKTLWFLAHETVFSDDDSYIMKGKQDYYIYYEPETQRFTPLEFDGNSALGTKNINWGVFYNELKVNYPLMNRLYSIPELRQRYLAHIRTIIDELFDIDYINSLIENYDALIRNSVASDTKNMNTYAEYLTSMTELKSYFINRRNILSANSEVQQMGLTISSVKHSVNDVFFATPADNESVNVSATITGTKDVNSIFLYYGSYYVGSFIKVEMFDDGQHNDGSVGDGIYGGTIPGFSSGEYVRYYVEAIANDAAKTASYLPIGAEHDVYYYRVAFNQSSSSDVVINEICASNSTLVADNHNEYDDWIELYNNTNESISLSGYYLTDDSDDLSQWAFPDISIEGNSYLIIWADKDEEQGENHAGFKLSASGEEVFFINQHGEIADQVSFGSLETDETFGRIPNGTGPFQEMVSTFNSENNNGNLTSSVINMEELNVRIYPNPATDYITIDNKRTIENISIYTIQGVKVLDTNPGVKSTQVNTSRFTTGIYFISVSNDLGETFSQKIILKK